MPHQKSLQRTTKEVREWFERAYRRSFRPQLDLHTQEIAQTLRSVPLFSEFNRGAIRTLAESLHAREYKRDEYIYRERDPGLGMYIVQSGRVRLLTEDEDGSLHESHQIGENEVFGHLALLGDFRRYETAQSITETRVLGFFRPELKVMIKRDPRTASVFLHALAGLAAEQHVSFYNLLIEKEGKMAATRMHDIATSRADTAAPNASFIIRP